jgi:hypothetical protein
MVRMRRPLLLPHRLGEIRIWGAPETHDSSANLVQTLRDGPAGENQENF